MGVPRPSARCWGDRCAAEEKVRHCDHLLGLAAVLSPGQSELRGNLLYHKSGALRHLLETSPGTEAEVTLGVASCRYSRWFPLSSNIGLILWTDARVITLLLDNYGRVSVVI